jgi:glycosyltransferase involved in cell wall biosynthesis
MPGLMDRYRTCLLHGKIERMKDSGKPKVSLITTERNEAEAIEAFLESALSQSMKPDEIVIADGGSTDGTIEIIEGYIKKGHPIKLVVAPGNRSIGRNAAVKAARNDIIACTDVGSRLDADWLRNITRPMVEKPEAMAVAGFFLPEPETYFERVSTTMMLAPNDKIDLETWLPSSRSVGFRKQAWEKVGGYPEHTNFNEDTPFDLALKAAGYRFEDGLDAIVYWRPRPNLKEFYKQYYFYAVGDGIDSIDARRIYGINLRYGLAVAAFVIAVIVSVKLGLVVLAILVLMQARRIYGPWKKIPGIKSAVLMVLLVSTYDLSQMRGYWYGRLNRERLRSSKKLVR